MSVTYLIVFALYLPLVLLLFERLLFELLFDEATYDTVSKGLACELRSEYEEPNVSPLPPPFVRRPLTCVLASYTVDGLNDLLEARELVSMSALG